MEMHRPLYGLTLCILQHSRQDLMSRYMLNACPDVMATVLFLLETGVPAALATVSLQCRGSVLTQEHIITATGWLESQGQLPPRGQSALVTWECTAILAQGLQRRQERVSLFLCLCHAAVFPGPQYNIRWSAKIHECSL